MSSDIALKTSKLVFHVQFTHLHMAGVGQWYQPCPPVAHRDAAETTKVSWTALLWLLQFAGLQVFSWLCLYEVPLKFHQHHLKVFNATSTLKLFWRPSAVAYIALINAYAQACMTWPFMIHWFMDCSSALLSICFESLCNWLALWCDDLEAMHRFKMLSINP